MTNRPTGSLQSLAPVQIFGALHTPAPSLRIALALCASTLLPLAGCGVATTITSGAVPARTHITGRVHGGQQPVVGATITLYAPGTTGYGSAPTAIVSTTTDGNGNFTLPRPYTCPANSPITYILSSGGNPGAGTNQYLAEAALLPACSSLTASTFINISEVTTVAAAYALAPFAALSAGTTNIGTSSTNLLGLTNALGPASNLANTTTGQAVTSVSGSGLILPTAEINTLADILSACVNTNTVAGTSGTCSSLFTAATPPNGTAPTDTFQAAIDIALNPGNNAAALYALSSAIAPYQPTLPSPGPSDFAVGIQYNYGLLYISAATAGVDIDASGNAWIATDNILSNIRTVPYGSINEISPAGVPISGMAGYIYGFVGTPYGVSIDANGTVFIADNYYNAVFELPSSGTNPIYYQPASLISPIGVAVDNRNASSWLTDSGINGFGTTVSHITAAGVNAAGSPYGSEDIPIGVAIDNAGNIWVANSDHFQTFPGNGFLTKFTVSGSTYTPQNFNTGAASFPFDVAIDGSGNAWVTDATGVAQFNNSGTQLSPSGGYSQNLYNRPESVIIDGLGRAWVSNIATDATGHTLGVPGSITAFSPTGTLISTSTSSTSAGTLLGYTAAGIIPQQPFSPQGIKIDPSGNLWITGVSSYRGAVTELIGIAAPVVTPLSVATSTGQLGTRP